MKESIKDKLEIVKEAICCWENGELSDLSALIAIYLTINKQNPSKECMEWAKQVIERREND